MVAGSLRERIEVPFDVQNLRVESGPAEAHVRLGWLRSVASAYTYVASVVEVEVTEKGDIRIPRIDTVVDAGTAVNPGNIRAQFEGSAVFGTSIARACKITATNGVIDQSNFYDYPVTRLHEAPYQTNVCVVDSSAPPASAAESGVSVIPPALCNAIFAATGKRIRELPLSKTRLL
jgi:isoquinoline 1-oxidoreductase beta subunit